MTVQRKTNFLETYVKIINVCKKIKSFNCALIEKKYLHFLRVFLQGNFKHTSSARRIKKEIRNKRTSFLGIEGQDDSYLDVDLKLVPRPDITSFLQEETKIERLLYKKTLSHDMDTKLRESRDSGVDVDRGPSAEAWYRGQSSPETSNPHSRQNSEVCLKIDNQQLGSI